MLSGPVLVTSWKTEMFFSRRYEIPYLLIFRIVHSLPICKRGTNFPVDFMSKLNIYRNTT